MARKRDRLGGRDPQRLLAQRISAFLGERQRPRNPALDVLTGAQPEMEAPPEERAEEVVALEMAEEVGAEAIEALEVAPAELEPPAAVRVGRGRTSFGTTVYLHYRDIAALDWLAHEWSKQAQRRVSRSEVLRRAIRFLRRENLGPFEDADE